MANRTRSQAARERTRDRRSPEDKAKEMGFLREKRAREILLQLREIREREDDLQMELWDLMESAK